MSANGNTAIAGALDDAVIGNVEDHPWVSQLPLPSRDERRRGLLAPVDTPVGRKQRPKLLYAGVAVGALLLIVVAQLALSIGVSNGAYRLNSLQLQQKQLGRDYQAASEADAKLSSPQNLAANADALGMVANGSPVYLRLSTGQVVGSPTAAKAASPAPAGASAASDATPLVPNALIGGVPLVTATTGPKPSQVATDQASVPSAQPGTQAGTQGTQQTGSKSDPGTPAANVDPQQNGPVAWSGLLPAPSTH